MIFAVFDPSPLTLCINCGFFTFMSYIIDQRKLLFLKKIRACDNSIVRSLSISSTYEYGKIMSKYSSHNPGSGVAELKSRLWRDLVDTVF